MPVDRPHQLLIPTGRRLPFESKGGGGKTTHPPAVANRRVGSGRTLNQIRKLIDAAEKLRDGGVDSAALPMTVSSTTQWGVSPSLPGSRRNDVLSALGFGKKARINVALDPSTFESFEAAASSYVGYSASSKRRPPHFNFFEASPSIAMTSVEDLWASRASLPGVDDEFWWEAWVQRSAEERFRNALEALGLANPPRALDFSGIRVIGLVATRRHFERIARSASIAQLRPASSLNTGLLNMPKGVKEAAVTAAARRISAAAEGSPAVCLLDTGVRRTHPLLAASVRLSDVAGGNYDADDYDGHGTKMAGLALFADLPSLLMGGSVQLSHCIESVTLRPPAGAAKPGVLPAAHLREAVDLVERNSSRRRTFCLAMNASEETDDGSPSSLSSEVDALAAEVAQRRLFCVSAGNLDVPLSHGDYADLNDTTPLLSPAQAWNALAVAACTDLADVPGTHAPVASAGDLCPWSRTAVNWERRHKPPSKPDVVFEGGNQMVDNVSADVGNHSALCLLTTSAEKKAFLTLTGQTSAATAAVAGICAALQAEYAKFWPETVRGLIVHSAEHTPAMLARADAAALRAGVPAQQALLERFGYGRADRSRALQDGSDSLTLVAQGQLDPLRLNKAGKGAVLGYMQFHQLPWPLKALEQLDQTEAELRVTLSYFIEPQPSAAVTQEAEMYASHGLDFDVMRPDETVEEAIGRVNAASPSRRKSSAAALPWRFGRYRGRGSLKHDRLATSAGDLARMAGITVFPRKGWWGEDLERVEQQVRYSLIVSIRTPASDIYTKIATTVSIGGG